jgi:signal peptidase I
MEPHIGSGEFVLIDTLAYRFRPIGRGDIVAFRHGGSAQAYLKRVIGLPGERVSIERGVVAIDGKPLAEGYVRFRDRGSIPARTVPAGAYFVLGDNRANSDDSRDWGPVPVSEIVGKAWLAVWPLDKVGLL